MKAYKFRIYPDETAIGSINQWFGQTRFVWNYFLAERNKYYDETGKGLSYCDNAKNLTALKKEEGYEWLKLCPSQGLQQSLVHLDSAFQSFFSRGKGFPKFKSKHRCHDSINLPQGFKLEGNKLSVPKLKKPIKVVRHRKIKGNIKNITLSKNPAGQYFVSILTDYEPNKLKPVKKQIGLDLGLKHFIVDSDGNKVNPPKFFEKGQKKLIKLQRRLSKKTKGSANKGKARLKVARCHNKIANQRTDFLHKLSTKLIRENQTVCMETLSVRNMQKNKRLASSISDASWSSFTTMLEYKAEWYGREIRKLDKWFPSSKKCHACGYIKENLKLSEREITCGKCGVTYDRDINAAKNILKFSTVGTTGIQACGESSSGHSGKTGCRNGSAKQEAHGSLARG